MFCLIASCRVPVLRRLSRAVGRRSLCTVTQFVNPLQLREEHVSMVYCLSSKEAKTTFSHGLPRKFTHQTDAMGRVCWVLRRQSYDIISQLRDTSRDTLEDCRFLLYGGDGSGKTLCMLQVMQHCIQDGWTVVHVPNVFTWTHSRRELRPSAKHPETFDQPEEASAWLRNFKSANSAVLSQLKLSEDQWWTKREKSTAGEDLEKVIDQGLVKPNLATDIARVVLGELVRSHSNYNLLLAVDAYNGCFNPTSLKVDNKWVEPEQLNLVRTVRELTEPGKFPGAILLALSRMGMRRHFVPGHSPEDLLGNEGVTVGASCRVVEIPDLERGEMEACVDYYTRERWFNKASSPAAVDELWYLTSGNPRELSRLCLSL